MSAHTNVPVALRYLSPLVLLAAIGIAFLALGVPPVHAAPLCVNTDGSGGCYTSIQAAVTAAVSGDTINVAPGTYYEHNITIDKSLMIVGTGPDASVIDGQGLARVFYIPTTSAVVMFQSLVIQNGINSGGPGGGILNAGNLTLYGTYVMSNTATSGGGILNTGALTIALSIVVSNTATSQGGGGIKNGSSSAQLTMAMAFVQNNRTIGGDRLGAGILLYTDSVASLTNVVVFANGVLSPPEQATYSGGGIYANANTSLTISQSAIFSNTILGGQGGGIYTGPGAVLTMDQSAVVDNIITNGTGAGIYNQGTASLTNVTISGNGGEIVNGGGIQNISGGTVSLLNATIVSNTLTGFSNGGGINNGGAVEMKNTIVSNNSAVTNGPNCFGSITSLGYNLENGNSCGLSSVGDKPNTDPLLGTLSFPSSFAVYVELRAASPAINGGTNVGCPSVDQRGYVRPQGGICDIGAYEAALLYLPLLAR